jgi:hypothetical protein
MGKTTIFPGYRYECNEGAPGRLWTALWAATPVVGFIEPGMAESA